jgi:hypothetical protein
VDIDAPCKCLDVRLSRCCLHLCTNAFRFRDNEIITRCVLLAVGVTYYLRLPSHLQTQTREPLHFREAFRKTIDTLTVPTTGIDYIKRPIYELEAVLLDEIGEYMKHVDVPPGIAYVWSGWG